jgi:DNA-binding MarR family transcriptional regulator
MIDRRSDPVDGRRRIIEPTEKAWALAPILVELAIYGHEHCGGVVDDQAMLKAAKNDRDAFIQHIRSAAAPV